MDLSDFQIIIEYAGKKYLVTVSVKHDLELSYVLTSVSPTLLLTDPFVDYNPQNGFYWKPEPVHPSFKPLVAKELARKMKKNPPKMG